MYLQSILVYSLLLFFMVVFGQIAAQRGKTVLNPDGTFLVKRSFWSIEIIIPLLLFATIVGMRYDVGVDHLNYIDGYLNKKHVGNKEPLFFLFSEIGWFFNFHYTVYFGIIAFVQVTFFFLAFKDERFLFPFLVFFIITNNDIGFWMNGIRQAVAMCYWIYSLRYIEKKSFIKYAILGIFAFLTHRSAILLFIFYPILKNGRDYFKSIPLQLLLLASAFVVKEIFHSVIMRADSFINFYISLLGLESYERSYNLEGLLGSFKEQEGTGLAYFFRILINIVIILYSKKLKTFYNNRKFTIVYFFFFLGLITFYMFPAGMISITRPFRYFYIFQSIMYAYFAYYLYRNRKIGKNMIILTVLIVSFLGIFVFSQLSATEHSHSLYQFFFQQKNIYGYPNKLI